MHPLKSTHPFVLCLALGSLALGSTANAQLTPIHTSADTGFFTLWEYRGKIFAGTYGGSNARVYRLDAEELVQEAHLSDVESVFVIRGTHDGPLFASVERVLWAPTVIVRDDLTATWSYRDIGHAYPRPDNAMGLGAGVGLGWMWVGSGPFRNLSDGYIYRSMDGESWQPVPFGDWGVPKVFEELGGRLYAATYRSGHPSYPRGYRPDSIYRFNGAAFDHVVNLPGSAGRSAVWRGRLYIGVDNRIVALDEAEHLSVVHTEGAGSSFFQDLDSVTMNDGIERLCAAWSTGWRASGGGCRVICTADGERWTRYQSLAESECWGLASMNDELYVGTRENAGHGRIYREAFTPPPSGTYIYEAEGDLVQHHIGAPEGDAWCANTGADRAGQFLFGPYADYWEEGEYVASFRLKIDNVDADDERVLRLDVYDVTADEILIFKDVARSEFTTPSVYQDIDLPFDTRGRGGHQFELRMHWDGIARACLDRVSVALEVTEPPAHDGGGGPDAGVPGSRDGDVPSHDGGHDGATEDCGESTALSGGCMCSAGPVPGAAFPHLGWLALAFGYARMRRRRDR